MKKFLKILIIIIGIVFLIFAALICIGLFVDYDDHIENGRYTKYLKNCYTIYWQFRKNYSELSFQKQLA